MRWEICVIGGYLLFACGDGEVGGRAEVRKRGVVVIALCWIVHVCHQATEVIGFGRHEAL